MKPHLVGVVCVLALVSCSPDLPPPGSEVRPGVPLFAGLVSYQTIDQVKGAIGTGSWRVVFDQGPQPSTDHRPRFDEVNVDVNVTECGQPSQLSLTFINDRLVSTLLTPVDLDTCVSALLARGFDFKTAQVGNDALHAWIGETPGRFLGLADRRLEEEMRQWIRRYA